MRVARWFLTAITPLAVAAVPVVSLWSRNAGEIDPAIVAAPLGLAVALAAITGIAAWVLLRRGSAAAALASGLMILFFGYGHGVQILIDLGLGMNHADTVVASLCGLLIAAAVWAAMRLQLDGVVLALAVASGAMLAMSGAELLLRSGSMDGSAARELGMEQFAPTQPGVHSPPIRMDSPETPDIYFIVLDGYARHDVLQAGFGHDNAGFLTKLEERGFYIARESASNYMLTHLSLSSSLNGVYLDEFVDEIGAEEKAETPFYELVRNNWVGRFLRARGYRYAQVYTNWGGTETSQIADLEYRFVPRWLGSEFAHVLLGTTALHRIRPGVADFHLFGLDAIKRVSSVEGPTFLLAHVLLPHDPYVFGRDGSVRAEVPLHLRHHIPTKRQTEGPDPVRSYVDQLVFLNRLLLEVIDHLLKHSPVPPVIVVQADHGWNSPPRKFANAAKRRAHRVRSRAAILNALRVPESVAKELYPDITPVNTFRLLFAKLFAADLELLPDRTYYSWYNAPLDFEDVTELIRKGTRRDQRKSRRGP